MGFWHLSTLRLVLFSASYSRIKTLLFLIGKIMPCNNCRASWWIEIVTSTQRCDFKAISRINRWLQSDEHWNFLKTGVKHSKIWLQSDLQVQPLTSVRQTLKFSENGSQTHGDWLRLTFLLKPLQISPSSCPSVNILISHYLKKKKR
jgi:hypothetical protein